MLQSSPLNYRRIIIWIGRLVMGAIFVYAGFAKLLLPNTHLWPYFFLKFSVSTNLTMFQQQVESYKMISPDAAGLLAHTLPFVEIFVGLMLIVGWGLRVWASVVTLKQYLVAGSRPLIVAVRVVPETVADPALRLFKPAMTR